MEEHYSLFHTDLWLSSMDDIGRDSSYFAQLQTTQPTMQSLLQCAEAFAQSTNAGTGTSCTKVPACPPDMDIVHVTWIQ